MRETKTRFRVEGMDCASCASKITNAVRHLPGVKDVSVSVTVGTMTVSHNGAALDAAVLRRMEQGRPPEAARAAAIARQEAAIERTLDLLEADPPANHLDIGSIAVACALGYLDLRYPESRWRNGRSKLAHWHEAMASRPELVRTAPPAGA